jgi:dCTP diphosphatase
MAAGAARPRDMLGVMTDIETFVIELRQVVAERAWSQFHNPKNLAMLLASEVGELVAEYRWVPGESADEHSQAGKPRQRIVDEIGDVGIALFLLCDRIGVDLMVAVSDKLKKNRERYPVEKARGKAERPEET